MLKLPAFKQFQFADGETATVFQDDTDFWVFYAIAGFPQVRMDKNDNPVFAMYQYAHSDQAREDDPDLPRGGGYMVFDAELRINDTNRDTMLGDLQTWVDNEYNRLTSGGGSMATRFKMKKAKTNQIGGHWSRTGHEGTQRAQAQEVVDLDKLMQMQKRNEPLDLPDSKPDVVIGEPLWKDGKVTMHAPEDANLVQSKLGERRASLIGNNVAAFNLTLTSEGATFMKNTLVSEDGSGASDLSPIQVAYELTMLAKLPPASMYLKFNTASVYQAVQELFHEHTNCSDDYFTSESMMSTAIESGLITVKIDMGGVTDDSLEQMLTQQAMNSVQELLANRFAAKERAPLEEWADDDLAESSREVYRLKQVTEIDMTNFEQTIELNTTTEYTIAPQGTLQTFFRDRTDMDAFVRSFSLDDDFFKTLGLKARAFANWEEDDVAFVEMQVDYKHGGEHKTQTFTFTPEDNEPKEWDPSLIDGKREYRHRYRIAFEGREPEEWSRWEKDSTRNLNVSVETPGKLEVTVTGVGLDFDNIVDAVLVHMRYEDSANDVPMMSQSLLLANDQLSGVWNRQLFAPWNKPLEYRVEYLLKSGNKVEQPWTRTDGPTQNVLISRPDVDQLDMTLIPAGDWTDVIQSVVSVRYVDGDYQKDQQFNIKTVEEFKKWAVLLVNPNQREFEYRVLATFKNGDTQETEWLKREGDQALPVQIQGPPRLTAKVSGQVLDYVSTPVVQVDMRHRADDGNEQIDSFTLQAPTDVHTWSVPIPDDSQRSYEHKISYFPVEGDPVVREWTTSQAELLMVPRYSIPKVGTEINPVLQNFGVTPAVEVNLKYDDPQNGVHEQMTLVFTDNTKQNWFLPVTDDAPREYVMTITWYYADGSQVTSNELKLAKPVVLLPKPPPQPAPAPAPAPSPAPNP